MTGQLPSELTQTPPPTEGGPRIDLPSQSVRLAWPMLATAMVVIEHGFFIPPAPLWALHLIQCLALVGYSQDLLARRRSGRDPFMTNNTYWLEAGLGLVALVGVVLSYYLGMHPYWRIVDGVSMACFFMEAWRLNVAMSRALARPGMLLPLSFATLILIGTILLMTPRATPHYFDEATQAYVATGEPLTFTEALFTATSAVCVTGLTVRNTAHDFSSFGMIIIASLIQLGGLGIIIFGSMIATLLGKGLSLKENLNLREMLNDQPLHRVRSFVRFIVIATFTIELIGAACSMPFWVDPEGGTLTLSHRVGMSLFHAVSAFCNAGFDITGDSMMPYRYSFLTHGILVSLIVIGGLGFPALENLYHVGCVKLVRMFRYQPVRPGRVVDLTKGRLSLHTKVVLTTTLCLYIWGVVLIGAGQLMSYARGPIQEDISASVEDPGPLTLGKIGGAIADAHFMAITCRTAGFNSMPMDNLAHAGRFTVITLMMVGGSPGSTAGGFKTTVIALLVLSVIATIRQRSCPEAFGRTITDALVRRAAALGLCYVMLVIISTLLLCLSERFTFEKLMFEAVSAATTTGLSLGITNELSGFGRAVIIATMFLGRVGPLALLGAMTFTHAAARPYRYAQEDVAIG